METVPIRDLQRHASAIVRRVRSGETLGVTDRGTLVAIMGPPRTAGGAAALIAAGRVRPATKKLDDIAPATTTQTIASVLDDLRGDR